jgi:hypothetical protein
MFTVIAIHKGSKEEKKLGTYDNEQDAEKFCEMWGWSYDDGCHSYWLCIEEE